MERETLNGRQLRAQLESYRAAIAQSEECAEQLRRELGDERRRTEQFSAQISNGSLVPYEAYEEMSSDFAQQTQLLRDEVAQLQ